MQTQRVGACASLVYICPCLFVPRHLHHRSIASVKMSPAVSVGEEKKMANYVCDAYIKERDARLIELIGCDKNERRAMRSRGKSSGKITAKRMQQQRQKSLISAKRVFTSLAGEWRSLSPSQIYSGTLRKKV